MHVFLDAIAGAVGGFSVRHPISAWRVRAMANLARAGRRVAVLVGAWTLAVLSLAAETAAEEIERPTFILEVPEPWVENTGMASDISAELMRQGDASAACLILVGMGNEQPTESVKADYDRFVASKDGPVTLALFMVGAQETVLETSRRRKGDSELVVVVSDKMGDRLATAYFFSVLVPGRLHTIRCKTAVENYAALEAEFVAIIDALEMKR
jgi:hypothetical protein